MPRPDSTLEGWIADNSSCIKLFTHDFRNPISAIVTNLGYIKTVLEDADEDTREAIEDSIQAVDSLMAMIGNFTQIGQLEAGEHQSQGSVKLDEFVRRSVKRCSRLFSASSPPIEIEDGIKYTINRKPAKKEPINDYYGMQGRFRHLPADVLEDIPIVQWKLLETFKKRNKNY